jgi:hypothetical protein
MARAPARAASLVREPRSGPWPRTRLRHRVTAWGRAASRARERRNAPRSRILPRVCTALHARELRAGRQRNARCRITRGTTPAPLHRCSHIEAAMRWPGAWLRAIKRRVIPRQPSGPRQRRVRSRHRSAPFHARLDLFRAEAHRSVAVAARLVEVCRATPSAGGVDLPKRCTTTHLSQAPQGQGGLSPPCRRGNSACSQSRCGATFPHLK